MYYLPGVMNKNNGCKITIFVLSFKKSVGESFSIWVIMRVKYGTSLFLANTILTYCESLEQVMFRDILAIIKYPC